LSAVLASYGAKPNPGEEERRIISHLESFDNPETTLVIPRDPQGRVAIWMTNDPRNLAEGLVLLLQKEIAVGEVFHLTAGSAFAFDEYVKYFSKVTGWPYVDITLPSVLHWDLSIAKARALLGYNPTRDIFQMIDEGWAAIQSATNA
jgi:nucleoside-diphosphate-sugar epimerase